MMRIKLIIVIAICLIAIMFAGCNDSTAEQKDRHPNVSHLENEKFATPVNPVISPSGKYLMVITEGFDDNVYDNTFAVFLKDNTGELIFTAENSYRTRDRLYFLWDDSDNIWVYSGDIGTTFWQYENDTWKKQAERPEELPEILNEALNK